MDSKTIGRIDEHLANSVELEVKLSDILCSAVCQQGQTADCESAVDDAMDICEELFDQLSAIHHLYRLERGCFE